MESQVVWLHIRDIHPGISPRQRDLDASHIAALSELEGDWPPILVLRHDRSVIDGHHRLAAAQSIGLERLAAILFDGTLEDGFVEAVRCNVQHGLPLTLQERRAAAQRVFKMHSDWSDRRIAEVCALSPRTIARIRAESGQANDPLGLRVGLDGLMRRARPASNRVRIMDALRANPHSSLRKIAQAVGASPETVRRVRMRMSDGAQSGPVSTSAIPPDLSNIVALSYPFPSSTTRFRSADDAALTSTPDGKEFAVWFDQTDPGPDWATHVMAVPLSRVYEVADEARRRASAWTQFGQLVEDRTHSSRAI